MEQLLLHGCRHNPLLCRHFVRPYSLGCTTPICYSMAEAVWAKSKHKKNRKKRVKIADRSAKYGFLSRSGSPCSHDHDKQLANTRTNTPCSFVWFANAFALALTGSDMQAMIFLRVCPHIIALLVGLQPTTIASRNWKPPLANVDKHRSGGCLLILVRRDHPNRSSVRCILGRGGGTILLNYSNPCSQLGCMYITGSRCIACPIGKSF